MMTITMMMKQVYFNNNLVSLISLAAPLINKAYGLAPTTLLIIIIILMMMMMVMVMIITG